MIFTIKNTIIRLLKVSIGLTCIILLTSSFDYEKQANIPTPQTENILPISKDIHKLRQNIDNIINEYNYYNCLSGISIVSLDSNQKLYEKNADIAMIPASNMKLVTTAAAYNLLNKDFRWTTSFYKSGQVYDGILQGDLYVKVQGDPTWNDSFKRNIIHLTFKNFADSLKSYGIQHITGNIYVDPGSLNDLKLGFGWEEEDRLHTYSAYPSAIAFNDNSIQVRITPKKEHANALVTIYPSNKGLDLINKTVITKNKRLQYFDFQTYPTENKLIVGGRIYDKSRTQYRSLSLPIPELYSLQLFKTNLENQKIKIFGTIDYKHFTETDMVLNQIEFLFEHNSLPLSTVIYEINKNSNNFMANQVFLTIGDQIDNTLQSENIIKQWLIDNNVNVLNLKMFDGSGLSSYNLCTANILTSVLKIMHESNDYQNYFKSLPISGVDGTLECQFGYNGLRKKIFAKTGTINGVRSLSGYTYTKDKELVAFSIILNKDNSKLHLSNTIMEKILKQILNFKRDTNLYANNKSLKS